MAHYNNLCYNSRWSDGDQNRAMCGVLLGGAALASVIGMVIQAVVGISYFFSRKNQLKFIKPKHVL